MSCGVSVKFLESRKSRDGSTTISGQTTIDYIWRVTGTNDISVIGPEVEVVRPNHVVDPVWNTKLIPVRLWWRQVGHQVYDYTIQYGNADRAQPQLQQGEMRFGFTSQGGSTHITRSINTRAIYQRVGIPAGEVEPPGFRDPFPIMDPPGTQGFMNYINININDLSVVPPSATAEGVDVITRQHHWWVEYAHPVAYVSNTYINNMWAMTGTVNNASFYGRASGELLFAGIDGEVSASSVAQTRVLRYNFLRKPNRTNVILPLPRQPQIDGMVQPPQRAIRIPFVEGWDYIWLRTIPHVLLGYTSYMVQLPVDIPTQAVVERIYHRTNFVNLGIGVGF